MSQTKSKKKAKPEPTRQLGRTPRIIFVGVIIVFILVALYVFSQPSRVPGRVGDFAPNFQLPEVNAEGFTGNIVEFSSLGGKAVVLEFMVSWCSVCREMTSSVGYLNDKYSGQGVVFLSVAGTQRGASAESTAEFIREYGATWTHVLDTGGTVFPRYGVEATPTYFIIDGSGKILSRFQGIVTTDAFSAAIEAALTG